jgi:hypothetical protein
MTEETQTQESGDVSPLPEEPLQQPETDDTDENQNIEQPETDDTDENQNIKSDRRAA